MTNTANKPLPRGIRNNNPGNIVAAGGKPWQGATGVDGLFVVFSSSVFGIRAMAKLLLKYQREHKLKTIYSILSRWAPPSENDTVRYASAVSGAVGVSPLASIDLTDPGVLLGVIKAMIKVENGIQPYSDVVLAEGISMALGNVAVPQPVVAAEDKALISAPTMEDTSTDSAVSTPVAAGPKPLANSRTMQGLGVAFVGQVVDFLTSNADTVAVVAGLINPVAGGLASKIITLAGLAYAAYARYDDYKKGVK